MLSIIVAEGPVEYPIWIRKDAGSLQRWWNRTKRNVGDAARGFREGTAFSRMIGERMFDSYREQMEKLRDTDEAIRSWTNDLDNCLDKALEASSKGKMFDSILWLSQINSRLKLVSQTKDQLSSLRDEQLEEFYGDRDHPLANDYFHADPKQIIDPDEKYATAGLMDDLGRWVTKRKLDTMYRRRLAEQKTALRSLLTSAKSTVNQIDSLLSRMGKARANGNIEIYINDLTKISALQEKFEGTFRELYDKHFKEMIKRIRQKEVKKIEQPRSLETITQPTVQPKEPMVELPSIMEPNDSMYSEKIEMGKGIGPTGTVPSAPIATTPLWQLTPPTEADLVTKPKDVEKPIPVAKEQLPLDFDVKIQNNDPIMTMEGVPTESIPTTKKPSTKKPAIKKTTPKKNEAKPKESSEEMEINKMMLRSSHRKFYEELQKATSTNDPKLLALMMLKYSEQIDELDSEKSLELIAIAEGILSDE